jgi:hypothetical protein
MNDKLRDLVERLRERRTRQRERRLEDAARRRGADTRPPIVPHGSTLAPPISDDWK